MNKSIQKLLLQTRPPRVNITYDVETENGTLKKELPFVCGIISCLTFDKTIKPYDQRQFVYLDASNINDFMQSLKPQVIIDMDVSNITNTTKTEEKAKEIKNDPKIEGKNNDSKTDQGGKISKNANASNQTIIINFKCLEDFHPNNLLKLPFFVDLMSEYNKFLDLKTRIFNSKKFVEKIQTLPKGGNLLESFSDADDHLKTLLPLFNEITNEDKFLGINQKITDLETIISKSLDTILKNPNFKTLEKNWMGLKYLIQNLALSSSLKLRVLHASYEELKTDLMNSLSFDGSHLFNLLYEQEYGTYGGIPYTTLGIDFYLENKQEHIDFIYKISGVAAAAHLPILMGISPEFFDLKTFEDIYQINDIASLLSSTKFGGFNGFRETEDSKYLGFMLPRFIGRTPYGPRTNRVSEFNFTEIINTHEDFLWTNLIYTGLAKIGESYILSGWFSAIVGPENGGKVENLTLYDYKSDNGDMIFKCPTEIVITDRREKELADSGIIAICYCKGKDYSSFFSFQSANKPAIYIEENATNNARLSSRLNYMINVSRFAHYIKAMLRDKIGSYKTANDMLNMINKWLSIYTIINSDLSNEILAKYPLKTFKVEVIETKPGVFESIIWLRPHFQMEELTVSLRLVAKIPERK